MERRKDLPVLFSAEKPANLFKMSGGNFVYFLSRHEEGNLLGFRAALVAGNWAICNRQNLKQSKLIAFWRSEKILSTK
ncbi:hypothetical protein BH10ACI1_BH10ACI1_10340 [soil metagenome]